MSNNFIFPHQGDPLLTDDALNQLEMYKQQLLAERQRVVQPKKQVATNDPWDDTEKELSALSDTQKAELMATEAFAEANAEVQMYMQDLLNNILKPEMLKSEKGIELLATRLNVVKDLKKKVVKESNKKMELFNEYTEKHSDISWEEFLKLKNK